MLFDAHTHVHFPAYDSDRAEVIRRAKEAGVKMVAVGTQEASSAAAIASAEENPGWVWAAVGFHPAHLAHDWHHDPKEQTNKKPETFNYGTFEALARHPKVVAVGECGFDYYRLDQSANRKAQIDKQKEVFLAQAAIAEKVGKALMIHCRPSKGTDDAYEDLFTLLKTENLKPKTIIHFYVGSLAITKKLIEAGCYFTFGGVVTFARDYDEVIRMVPLDRMLTETDAPYVAPEPYRGKRNEPSYIIRTAEKLAEVKGISYNEISAQTTANAGKVFGISA